MSIDCFTRLPLTFQMVVLLHRPLPMQRGTMVQLTVLQLHSPEAKPPEDEPPLLRWVKAWS